MSVKDYNKKRNDYIDNVYKNLTFIKCKTPGCVANYDIFNFVNMYKEKYCLIRERGQLVKICKFETSWINPTLSEIKKMVAAALKVEQVYKQHKMDSKFKEIEKDFK